MERPLEIRAHEIDLSAAERRLVEEEVRKLEKFTSDLIGCDVFVEGPGSHHREGAPYSVRLRLNVRDREIAVSRQVAATLREAVDKAFPAARRLLQDYVRQRRGFVKQHEPPARGRVVRLLPEQACGFLETEDGREIYFHRNALLSPSFDRVKVGDLVRYVEEQGDEGPQASSLQILER